MRRARLARAAALRQTGTRCDAPRALQRSAADAPCKRPVPQRLGQNVAAGLSHHRAAVHLDAAEQGLGLECKVDLLALAQVSRRPGRRRRSGVFFQRWRLCRGVRTSRSAALLPRRRTIIVLLREPSDYAWPCVAARPSSRWSSSKLGHGGCSAAGPRLAARPGRAPAAGPQDSSPRERAGRGAQRKVAVPPHFGPGRPRGQGRYN